MAKAKYIVSADVPNPLKGKNGRGDSIAVYDDEDLTRRQDAAKEAGVELTVKRL